MQNATSGSFTSFSFPLKILNAVCVHRHEHVNTCQSLYVKVKDKLQDSVLSFHHGVCEFLTHVFRFSGSTFMHWATSQVHSSSSFASTVNYIHDSGLPPGSPASRPLDAQFSFIAFPVDFLLSVDCVDWWQGNDLRIVTNHMPPDHF